MAAVVAESRPPDSSTTALRDSDWSFCGMMMYEIASAYKHGPFHPSTYHATMHDPS
jgi:hypothetical protein